MSLESQHPHHDDELHQGGETGAEGEDPPEEVAVPDVEDEVGHGHGGGGVQADGQQRLDGGEHGHARQETNLES